MALFGNKKKTPAPRASAESAKAAPKVKREKAGHAHVLIRPRITEKAANLTAEGVYTFNVALYATKESVARTIEAVYKVRPLKIRIVRTPGKRVSLRTRRGFGRRNQTKKAYVYLKKGDRIEFAS